LRGVKQLVLIVVVVFATTLLLAAGTEYVGDTGHSRAVFFGYPMVAYAQKGAVGIIALGQTDAWGVLTIAQFGGGLVAFTQIGFGVLFSVSQVTAGLLAIAQGGIGLFGFVGQMGAGVHAFGQGVIGYAAAGQGAAAAKGADYLRELSAELGEVLAPPRLPRR
jgi:hypothetical protein